MSERPWRIEGAAPILARRPPGRPPMDRILRLLCWIGWHAGPIFRSETEGWKWCARCDRQWEYRK